MHQWYVNSKAGAGWDLRGGAAIHPITLLLTLTLYPTLAGALRQIQTILGHRKVWKVVTAVRQWRLRSLTEIWTTRWDIEQDRALRERKEADAKHKTERKEIKAHALATPTCTLIPTWVHRLAMTRPCKRS